MLRPQWSLLGAHAPPVKNTVEPEAAIWNDSGTYDGVALSNFQGLSVDQAQFVTSLWRMIDQYLEDNPFLSEYNHTGQVFLQFAVDANGKLEGHTFQASAIDRVLKVIASRAVRKALKNDTGDVHFPAQHMLINARFNWRGYEACNSLRGFKANYLSFCHYAEDKRKTFSSGEKVATWAGEIYQHGPWAYDEIQKYQREESRRNTQYDPFEEYSRDPDWNL